MTDNNTRPGLVPNGFRPRDLFTNDPSVGFAALRSMPRATPEPVHVEVTHGAMAQALGTALASKLRVDSRITRAGEGYYVWDGTRWIGVTGDAGLDAVRAFVEPWDAADVGEGAAQRRIIPVKYVEADPLDSHHRATVTAMGGKLVQPPEGDAYYVDAAGTRIAHLPEQADRWIMEARNSAAVAKLLRSDARLRVPQAEPGAVANDWDSDPLLLATPTGYLDLDKQTYSPPDPALLITKMTGARFDPAAVCPNWEQFMEQVQPDPEQRAYLQRAIGMTLLGEVRENAIFCLTGTGANGKSVFTEVISHVLGDYVVAFDSKHLMAGRGEADSGSASPHLIPLRGARMTISSEVPPGKSWDVERLKAWSGGDRISARPLYGSEITFPVSHTLWITSNGTPSIPPDNAAFWRRYRGVSFPARFATKDTELIGATAIADPTLTRRLKEEEADGILNWIIAGYLSYRTMGLADPPSVLQATEEAKRKSAPWTAFVSECLTLTGDPADEIEVGHLYSVWEEYRERDSDFSGHRPNSARMVADALRGELPAVGYTPKRNGRERSRVTGVRFTEFGETYVQDVQKKTHLRSGDGPQFVPHA